MNEPMDYPRSSLPAWLGKFPDLRGIADPAWVDIARRAREVAFPAGIEVFREIDGWKHYLFVIEGTIGVYKSYRSSNEMLLYRVQAGETCCLTTSLLFDGEHYDTTGVAEVTTRAALVPAHDFREAFSTSSDLRDFVCAMFGKHLCESHAAGNRQHASGGYPADQPQRNYG